MSTPSSSSAGVSPRRIVIAAAIATLLFMGLAMLEEREIFLSAWGLTPEPEAIAPPPFGSEALDQVVRQFATDLSNGYGDRTLAGLSPEVAAPAVREAYAAELAFSRSRGERPLALINLAVVRTRPTAAGGTVLTDETWQAQAEEGTEPRPHRLRYRYRLAIVEGRPQIVEIAPVLPEPKLARD